MIETPPVIIVLDHVKPENIRNIPDRREVTHTEHQLVQRVGKRPYR